MIARLPLLALVPLAACAADRSAYPSLAPRAAEALSVAEPAVTAEPRAAVDPGLDARLSEISAALASNARRFATARAAAEQSGRAARGRPAGSEPWIAAQIALTALDDLQAELVAHVADLDAVAGERSATLAPDYPALEALRRAAARQATEQRAAIGTLGAALAPA